jgi:hypothetical protein
VVKEYRTFYKAYRERGTIGIGRQVKRVILRTKEVVYLGTNP